MRRVRVPLLAALALLCALDGRVARAQCTDLDGDGFASAWPEALETLSSTPQPYFNTDYRLLMGAAGTPHVLWKGYGSPGGIFVGRWNGSDWSAMSGTPGAENIAGTYEGLYRYTNYYFHADFDPSGRLVVLWKESISIPPYYPQYVTRWDGTQWTDLSGNPGRQILPSFVDGVVQMAFDPQGRPMLLMARYLGPLGGGGQTDLFFTRWDGTQWVSMAGDQGMENITDSPANTFYEKLLLDGSGAPVIVWSEPTGDAGMSDLFLARWNGGAWGRMDGTSGVENLTQTPTRNSRLSGAEFDADDRLHLTWLEVEQLPDRWLTQVQYRSFDGTGWSAVEYPAGEAGAKGDALLAIETNGRPTVLWVDGSEGSQVRLARRINGSWGKLDGTPGYEVAPSNGNNVKGMQLVLDSRGRPNLVWYTFIGLYDVYFTGWDGERWVGRSGRAIDRLSNFSGSSTVPRLAFDAEDRPNVIWHNILRVYYGSSYIDTHSVKYTYWNGTTWAARTSACGAHDCNDRDSAAFPGAIEVCSDSLDNDCDGWTDRSDSQCPANAPPVADAGPDQAIVVIGTRVQLDGSTSYDVDGDRITYAWDILSAPPGSAATLEGADAATPSFVADVHGDYLLQLVVSDPWETSTPDPLVVSFNNVRPVAAAGVNQSVLEGDLISLDGSASWDANGDVLAFSWSLASAPEGSGAALSGPASVAPEFTADLAGEYLVSLVVDDGFEPSEQSFVTVLAVRRVDAVTALLMEEIGQVNALNPQQLVNPNQRNALTNKLQSVIRIVDEGRYADALEKLLNDVIPKTDGCALSGAVDTTDWITDCEGQALVYPTVVRMTEILRTMI